MAIVSRLEFGEMCSIDTDALRSYISRGKVIVHGEKKELIDTTHPVNKAFKENRKAKASAKHQVQEIISRIPKAIKYDKSKSEDNEDDDIDAPPDEAIMALFAGNKGGRRSKEGEGDTDSTAKYFKMKIKGDAELVSVRVIKEKMALEKLAGKLIPIDIASDVLKSHAKVIFSNLENAIESLADIFCNRAGVGPEVRAMFVEDARGELRKFITLAGKDAKSELENIIQNSADTKLK